MTKREMIGTKNRGKQVKAQITYFLYILLLTESVFYWVEFWSFFLIQYQQENLKAKSITGYKK